MYSISGIHIILVLLIPSHSPYSLPTWYLFYSFIIYLFSYSFIYLSTGYFQARLVTYVFVYYLAYHFIHVLPISYSFPFAPANSPFHSYLFRYLVIHYLFTIHSPLFLICIYICSRLLSIPSHSPLFVPLLDMHYYLFIYSLSTVYYY